MIFKHTYKAILIFCVMTTICSSPLSETKGKAGDSFSHLRGETDERFLPEIAKHRERRQTSPFGWNNGLLQNLGNTISNSLGRFRDVVSNSAASDSPLVRMVNDLRSVIVRTVFAGVWDQIRNRARVTANEFFDTIGGL